MKKNYLNMNLFICRKFIGLLKISLFLPGFLLISSFHTSEGWEPKKEKLMTTWGERIDPTNVFPEYPRPILEREEWLNLNGLWDYAILPAGSEVPQNFTGKILVPFPVESALSGVKEKVGESNELWYHRNFSIPDKWENKNIRINFGGVDWKATVWINGKNVGEHTGGFAPFSFDVTPFIINGGDQHIVVRVWDPTEKGTQPVGKQRSEYFEVWYRPVTGIWQTVWLEPVAEHYIHAVKTTPDIDHKRLTIHVKTNEENPGEKVGISVYKDEKKILTYNGLSNTDLDLPIEEIRLWSPDDPFLYDLEIKLMNGQEVLDEVKSYFGMRKISLKRDSEGILRLALNNEFLFQYGPLDQGFWPDGIYTAPSDSALIWDVANTKLLGFNMIRKHVKTEPQRWYYHCDRLGMLVWQDMPSGDRKAEWSGPSGIDGKEIVRTGESENQYRKEWKEIIDFLYPHPSIVVWVPFNEGWGQFKTVELINWTKNYDPSRLTDGPSGGNNFPVGDIVDHHQYPGPAMPGLVTDRAMVLGEFGAIPMQIPGHSWYDEVNFRIKTSEELTDAYIDICNKLKPLIKNGLSAAVYCQTSDIEGVWREDNGFFTYDRKVVKFNVDKTFKINQEIVNSLDNATAMELLPYLFESGTDGYHTFRIPAIVTTKKGTLLAFAEGRRNSTSDTGDIDLVLKRSEDGGKTWSGLSVIWSDSGNVCGNPAPVVDRATGKIFLLSTWNLGTDHEPDIIDNKSEDTRRVFVLSSSDDGKTWSKPKEITGAVKKSDWTWYATGPGHGIQIENGRHRGRMVIPCDHIELGTKKYFSHIIYSDNLGKSWKLGGSTPQDQVNECTVAELTDGRLMLNMRNYDREEKSRKVSISNDGGETWSNIFSDKTLIEPICQAGLLRYSSDGTIKLLFLNPADENERKNMTIRVSEDDGSTWSGKKVLFDGPSAYSDLTVLPNGNVGCLYEGGTLHPYQGIVFQEVRMGEIQ